MPQFQLWFDVIRPEDFYPSYSKSAVSSFNPFPEKELRSGDELETPRSSGELETSRPDSELETPRLDTESQVKGHPKGAKKGLDSLSAKKPTNSLPGQAHQSIAKYTLAFPLVVSENGKKPYTTKFKLGVLSYWQHTTMIWPSEIIGKPTLKLVCEQYKIPTTTTISRWKTEDSDLLLAQLNADDFE